MKTERMSKRKRCQVAVDFPPITKYFKHVVPAESTQSPVASSVTRSDACESGESLEHDVRLVKRVMAKCQRASRAARASGPSSEAASRAYGAMMTRSLEISRRGIKEAPKEVTAYRPYTRCGAGGKGPGVVSTPLDQRLMNHLAGLKAKSVETYNNEPVYVLGGCTAPMCWDKLAESSLRSNAVSSSVLDRKKTQGAASQTTRISCKAIGQAASAQVVAVALATAEARRLMRRKGLRTTNAIATNSVNPCMLAFAEETNCVFCVTSTSKLVYNANQVRLSSASLLSTAQELATRELESYTISDAMGTRSGALVNVCRSLVGQGALDAVWCAWALVVYLLSHPRGRDVLRTTQITDVDVQSAVAFERYGSEEVRRRERQQRSADNPDVHRGPSWASNDAHAIIEFWSKALQSAHVSVLYTLAAHNKRTARDAALSTLARQADNTTIAYNSVLQNVSLTNAVKSATALVSFVGRRIEDIPAVVAVGWSKDGVESRAFAMSRVAKEAASSALHACVVMHASVQPAPRLRIMVAWSRATKKLLPRDEQSAVVPGVLERVAESERLKASESGGRVGKKISMLNNFVDSESEIAMPQNYTGTTRSFISLQSCIRMTHSHVEAANGILDEALALDKSLDSVGNDMPLVLGFSQDSARRVEPLCTPSSPLALGLCANETLRRWLAGKTRKGDPCRKDLGFIDHAEFHRDVPDVLSSEPLPLLTITDFGIERIEDASTNSVAPVALALHVCGDGAARVAECLFAVQSKLCDDPVAAVKECRAGLFVAASQSSYIGSVGSCLSAGYINASVASSKKVSVAAFLSSPPTR